jgi:apolipoprotein D and lipocalin family protein
MIEHMLKTTASRLTLLAVLLAVVRMEAQTVTPIPKLDLNQYTGTWYEMARYPIKREKECIGEEMMLYALGDKPNSFQLVTSCKIKDDNSDSWNGKGKMDKTGNGELNVLSIWPFHTKYWVLAIDPAYEWALVGSPNHKSLWILSRATTIKPETLAEIEAKAAAEGFDTSKLKPMPQRKETTSIASGAPIQP